MSLHQTITTPEGVDITLELAGIGSRIAALLIDHVLQIILMIALGFGGLKILEVLTLSADAGSRDPWLSTLVLLVNDHLVAVMILGAFLIWWGYFIYFEAFMDGRTPGKRWCKLRVRTETGAPAHFSQIALRNLVRIVDMVPGFYGIGLLTMFIHPQQKRLGDLVAGTIVVKDRPVLLEAVLAPAEAFRTFPDSSAAVMLPHLDRLDQRDVDLLTKYAQRRADLPPDGRRAIAEKLAKDFRARLQLEDDGDPEALLRRLLEQYQERRRMIRP